MPGPAPSVAATRKVVRDCLRDLRGSTVLVAVSGGADSLALLAAVAFEAPKADVVAVAVTVDHQLQPGSAEQAETVLKQAAQLGVDARSVPVDVDGPGGPEAAARTARYAALAEAAADLGATAVLLGHTLDDQAETVLLGLARGAGARSLAGMAPVDGLWRRPFLEVRRRQTVDACSALGLTPWHDPMNLDTDYTRVRVRDRALPALEAALDRDVATALARTASQLREDNEALDALAAASPGLGVDELSDLSAAVRKRVLRAALLEAGVPGGALLSTHVVEVDRLVSDWHGQGPVALPGGREAVRDCDRLLIRGGLASPELPSD